MGFPCGHSELNQADHIRTAGETSTCLYCLRKALSVDPKDVECLWEMASIYRAQEQDSKVGGRRTQ